MVKIKNSLNTLSVSALNMDPLYDLDNMIKSLNGIKSDVEFQMHIPHTPAIHPHTYRVIDPYTSGNGSPNMGA